MAPLRTVLAALALTAAFAVAGAPPAWAATPQLPASTPVNCTPIPGSGVGCPPENPSTPYGGLDHFLCWNPTSDPFTTPTVTVQDQFGTLGPLQPQVADPTASTTNWLCSPAQKTIQPAGPVYGVSNPQAHLMCLNDSGPAPDVMVTVTNQFGTEPLTVGAPNMLCLPSWKFDDNASTSNPLAVAGSVPTSQWTDPSNLALNHFQCYEMAQPYPVFGDYDRTITVEDQFGTWDMLVGVVPNELCAPAVKTVVDAGGNPLTPPSEINSDGFSGVHLLCFPIAGIIGSPTAPTSSTVEVGNQFTQSPVPGTPGAVPGSVTVGGLGGIPALCLPTFKAVVPGSGTPEAPAAVLLPLAGVATAGGVFWTLRRRGKKRAVGPVSA